MADDTKPTTTPPPMGAKPTMPPRPAGAAAPGGFKPNPSMGGAAPFGGARPGGAAGGFGASRPNPAGAGFGAGGGFGANAAAGAKTTNTQAQQSEPAGNADLIMSIPVEVQVVLGGTTMPVATLMNLGRGAVITLDKQIGDPVDIVVNGRVIARGEVIVMEDDSSRFGVSLTEIIGK
nr:flagellar motor switch protein FliN [uncultured Bartonella sp.]